MLDADQGILRALVTGALLTLVGASFAACGSSDSGGGGDGVADSGSGTPDAAGNTDSGGGTDAGSDAPTTGTVSGRLVARVYHQPVPNAAVLVNGKPVQTSSATGTFSVPDVTPPYDIAIAAGTSSVTVYKGLRRLDPVLTVYDVDQSSLLKTAPVSGTASTAPFTGTLAIVFTGPLHAYGYAVGNPMSGAYTMDANWSGANQIAGTVYAVNEVGAPATNGYFGKTDNVSLTAGFPASNQNIATAQVGVTTIAGTISTPAAYASFQRETGYTVAPGTIALAHKTVPASPTTYTDAMVRFPNGTVWVAAEFNPMQDPGEISWARKSAPSSAASSTVDLALLDAPRPSSPANAATGVNATTTFAYSAVPNAIYHVAIDGSGQPKFHVFTAELSTTIPDTSGVGVALPKNAAMGWRIYAHGPYTSMDDLTKDENLAYYERELTDVIYCGSARGTLTTAP